MDDIRAVMDAAAMDQAVVVGISEGGPMAILFAATYPQRVRALVLYGSIVKIDAPGEPAVPLEPFDRFRELLDDWGQGRTIEFFAPDLAHDPLQRRLWGVWERTGASPAMARTLYAACRQWDVRPVLATVTAPTLVLHRTGDRIPIEGARYLAEHIPGASMIELPGNNHVVFEPDIIDRVGRAIQEFVLGSARPQPSERVLFSVLFTDIVASTEKLAALGDRRWRAVLEDHHELVRGLIEQYRGHEIKTLGDGFLATFDGPGRALECALALAAAVAVLDLAIRAGVHTGECEVIGDDIGGLAVHVAARVASLAAPGEVLVTGTVRDLVIGSSFGYEDRGRHQLKGVPGDWSLYAVVEETASGDTMLMPTSTPPTTLTDKTLERIARRAPRLARAGLTVSRKVATARRREPPGSPSRH